MGPPKGQQTRNSFFIFLSSVNERRRQWRINSSPIKAFAWPCSFLGCLLAGALGNGIWQPYFISSIQNLLTVSLIMGIRTTIAHIVFLLHARHAPQKTTFIHHGLLRLERAFTGCSRLNFATGCTRVLMIRIHFRIAENVFEARNRAFEFNYQKMNTF